MTIIEIREYRSFIAKYLKRINLDETIYRGFGWTLRPVLVVNYFMVNFGQSPVLSVVIYIPKTDPTSI